MKLIVTGAYLQAHLSRFHTQNHQMSKTNANSDISPNSNHDNEVTEARSTQESSEINKNKEPLQGNSTSQGKAHVDPSSSGLDDNVLKNGEKNSSFNRDSESREKREKEPEIEIIQENGTSKGTKTTSSDTSADGEKSPVNHTNDNSKQSESDQESVAKSQKNEYKYKRDLTTNANDDPPAQNRETPSSTNRGQPSSNGNGVKNEDKNAWIAPNPAILSQKPYSQQAHPQPYSQILSGSVSQSYAYPPPFHYYIPQGALPLQPYIYASQGQPQSYIQEGQILQQGQILNAQPTQGTSQTNSYYPPPQQAPVFPAQASAPGKTGPSEPMQNVSAPVSDASIRPYSAILGNTNLSHNGNKQDTHVPIYGYYPQRPYPYSYAPIQPKMAGIQPQPQLKGIQNHIHQNQSPKEEKLPPPLAVHGSPADSSASIVTPPPYKRQKLNSAQGSAHTAQSSFSSSSMSSQGWPLSTTNSSGSLQPWTPLHSGSTSCSNSKHGSCAITSPSDPNHASPPSHVHAGAKMGPPMHFQPPHGMQGYIPVHHTGNSLMPGQSMHSLISRCNGNGYSRKDKALGLLAQKLISYYEYQTREHRSRISGADLHHNQPLIVLSIDQTASHLGVERRRIYDIINILEALDIVSKKGKNVYWWHGIDGLIITFQRMQKEAIVKDGEFKSDALENKIVTQKDIDAAGEIGPSFFERNDEKSAEPVKAYSAMLKEGLKDASRRKNTFGSLGTLSKKFLQLYLVGYDILSLGDATERLLGEECVSTDNSKSTTNSNKDEKIDESNKKRSSEEVKGWKTKVRRLYDIANVLVSIGIIEKTATTHAVHGNIMKSKKPRKLSESGREIPMHKNNQYFCWKYHVSPYEIKKLSFQFVDNGKINVQDSATKSKDSSHKENDPIPSDNKNDHKSDSTGSKEQLESKSSVSIDLSSSKSKADSLCKGTIPCKNEKAKENGSHDKNETEVSTC